MLAGKDNRLPLLPHEGPNDGGNRPLFQAGCFQAPRTITKDGYHKWHQNRQLI